MNFKLAERTTTACSGVTLPWFPCQYKTVRGHPILSAVIWPLQHQWQCPMFSPQGAFEWHFTSTAPRCLYGLSALIHPRNHANAALSNAQRDIGSSGARREASDAPFTGSSGPELVAPRRRTATARCTPTSSRHPLRKPSARIARPAAPCARGNATDKSRLFQRSDASPPSPGLNFLFSLRRSAPEGRLLLNGGAS